MGKKWNVEISETDRDERGREGERERKKIIKIIFCQCTLQIS